MTKALFPAAVLCIVLLCTGPAAALSNDGGGDWLYSVDLYIQENSGQDLADYPVIVELDEQDLDFSKARADGGDIRFTDESGAIEFAYWTGFFDRTAETARFLVLIPTLPASGRMTVKLHYGNEKALPVSDEEGIFLWFDRFDTDTTSHYASTSLDPRASEENIADAFFWNASTEEMMGNSIPYDHYGLLTDVSLDEFAIRATMRTENASNTKSYFGHVLGFADRTTGAAVSLYPNSYIQELIVLERVTGQDSVNSTDYPSGIGRKYTIEARRSSDNVRIYINGAFVRQMPLVRDTIPGRAGLFCGNYGPVYFDDLMVWKYVYPEPTVQTEADIRIFLDVRYKNTLLIDEGAAIDIRVTDGSSPVPAGITVRLDGTTVATHNGPDYRYSFLPFHAGTYPFEVIARRGTQEKHYFGSIVVVDEEVSHAILGADRIHQTAIAEVDQALVIPAEKTVGFMSDIAIDAITGFIAGLMKPIISYTGQFLDLGEVRMLDGTTEDLESFFVQDYALIRKAGWDRALDLGFSTVEGYFVDCTRQQYSGLWGVETNLGRIRDTQSGFVQFIVDNPTLVADRGKVDGLFVRYSAPIGNVVEKYPIIEVPAVPIIGDVRVTMKGEADLYQTVSDVAGVLQFVVIVGALVAVIVIIVVSIASGVGIAALVMTVVSSVSQLSSIISTVMSFAKGLKFVLVILLFFAIPVVVTQVEVQHADSVSAIEEALSRSSTGPLSVTATGSRVFGTSAITTTGHALIVSPDGRIMKIIRDRGAVTPLVPGEYSVVAYSHQGALFSGIESTSFAATVPNVTMAVAKAVTGTQAQVTCTVCNRESARVENLSVILGIRNSTEGLTSLSWQFFSLDAGACSDRAFTADLPGEDVYTGTASLSYSLLVPIAEEGFFLTVGSPVVDDIAIVSVKPPAINSPLKNVTIPITLVNTTPNMLVKVRVPAYKYNYSVRVAGTRTVTMTLPRLPPDEYTTAVIVEKDGRVLDGRVMRFMVSAAGVGVLTLKPGQVYYPAPVPVNVNLTLTDLNLTAVSATMSGWVVDPAGKKKTYAVTMLAPGEYRFGFVPALNGTYVIGASAVKIGWRINGAETPVIVGEMSRLNMSVNRSDDSVVARVFANRMPAACDISLVSGDEVVTRSVTDGVAVFNRTEGFTLTASKVFYEPAFFAMPGAGFSAEPRSGTAPLRVAFSDRSTGQVDAWYWEFGDGASSDRRNPVHTYSVPGTYRVNLTVTGSQIHDRESRDQYVVVYSAGVIPLPGYTSPPTDPDGDGVYEDLNGNGRLDFADVVLYFTQMDWIAGNEPVTAFDLNGNGRIDFADIVALFNEI